MPTGARYIDRLLPRHEPPGDLELDWHVHVERVGFLKKEELHHRGVVCDLSLEGALVRVDDADKHQVGDEIAVRFRGLDGTATIRHIQRTEDDEVHFGVRFEPAPAFRDAIDLAVGELRGHSSELSTAWNRAN
ncbi:MAG: PilZ domain-containing protein [Acidimicrobiales bacterium]|nr:PilZ domain-containing protein [Acidimicrobiales bacterium]